MDTLIAQIIGQAQQDDRIQVLWLYGSRARGISTPSSDYNLAVAFLEHDHVNDRHSRAEDLRFQWTKIFLKQKISLVDIALVPVPLAYNIIGDDHVLFCRDYLRLHSEEHRIWALWSEYQREHKTNRR